MNGEYRRDVTSVIDAIENDVQEALNVLEKVQDSDDTMTLGKTIKLLEGSKNNELL